MWTIIPNFVGIGGWDITQRRFELVVLDVWKGLDRNCAFVDNVQPRRDMRCISGWPYFSSQDWMSTDWNWFTMKALIVMNSKLNGFTMDLWKHQCNKWTSDDCQQTKTGSQYSTKKNKMLNSTFVVDGPQQWYLISKSLNHTATLPLISECQRTKIGSRCSAKFNFCCGLWLISWAVLPLSLSTNKIFKSNRLEDCSRGKSCWRKLIFNNWSLDLKYSKLLNVL